jgi:hypothetical protein
MNQQRIACDEVSFCAAASSLPLVKFILARFYQNVSEVVYEGYKAR